VNFKFAQNRKLHKLSHYLSIPWLAIRPDGY